MEMSRRVRRKKIGEPMTRKGWAFLLALCGAFGAMLLSLIVEEKQPGWLMTLGVFFGAGLLCWSGVEVSKEIQQGPNEYLKKRRRMYDRISSMYFYKPFLKLNRNMPLWVYWMNAALFIIAGLILLLLAFLMLMELLLGFPVTITIPLQ
jgi:hypothetical protein